ncbi:helix-turn-helix domain-containing protein [Streptococcus moroccensis]|uniref:Transcriptional regulator with XRE-family HTH domain n=1 Tax=Streptococcus moroccensis TaxID=1451356 RepID=A0ABT9YQ44_9STRE|nr:helix-turn-helix transcriptional regulator [Streptococcus moroccensis]MDQ0222017.1 transcriptional regulator with XRE-family HTH domain [Streptococcus moroccensis]
MWESIERLLKDQKITAYALAKKADVNYQMLAELKSGKKKDLKFANVCKLADALGVSTEEFR